MKTDWQEQAGSILEGIKQIKNYPMAELTTFKIGGPADLLVEPADVSQLSRVREFCRDFSVPWMLLGLGSNLLVRDKGIRGVVIKLAGQFLAWERDGSTVRAGAGLNLGELARETAREGLSGLEFACGIPGTVGGAAYMNAGAYDGEMEQVLQRVQAYSLEQGLRWYSKEELELGYRKSRFQSRPEIIVMVELGLTPVDSQTCLAKIADLTDRRESKQPLELPSAGSVFRRPEGYYVGPLIEGAGLKGYTIGGAQVSLKHAGFIVNIGGATADDVLRLIAHIQQEIKSKYGVDLVPEIKVVGEE